jgi:uncharacterized membrane protein YraQ (UPF0718 family)
MELIILYFQNFLELLNAMAIYILAGITFAYIFDAYFPPLDIVTFINHKEEITILNSVSSVIMMLLMLYFLIKPIVQKENK